MGERLRYTFGELQLGLPRPGTLRADFFVFLRLGRALSRRDERYYNGLALGLDLPFIRGPEGGKEHEGIYSAYARLWLGFQDYDTIDRIGAVSPVERDDSVEEQEELSSEDIRNMSIEELNEWARNRRQRRANEEMASSQPEMNLSNTLTIGGTLNWSW